MNCAEVRLDEFLDGELPEPDRTGVETHLSSCAMCRSELERSRRLEAVLRSLPASPNTGAGEASPGFPDVDRFVQGVRSRSRRRVPPPWLLAAAALLLVAGLVGLLREGGAVDVAAELSRFAQKPSPEIEDRIRSTGPAGLAALESALNGGDVRRQFAAASLLFKLADGPTRDRVLARYQQKKEAASGWTLSEPGTDDEDSELVPVAVSLAVNGQDARALAMLQKLNRLNRAAQHRIVEAVVTLLHSTNVEVQSHALEIVKKLDIEFPLPALVELLDSPELGQEALRFLKQETKKDFGLDKQAWLKAIGG
ncbi:MAG TPA: zf-HC2 domain-containing protein [Planctomycetota bacterium]|nr:zf-HC2 domain-containing protein [Planctomycetota bacterium]